MAYTAVSRFGKYTPKLTRLPVPGVFVILQLIVPVHPEAGAALTVDANKNRALYENHQRDDSRTPRSLKLDLSHHRKSHHSNMCTRRRVSKTRQQTRGAKSGMCAVQRSRRLTRYVQFVQALQMQLLPRKTTNLTHKTRKGVTRDVNCVLENKTKKLTKPRCFICVAVFDVPY